MTRKGEKLKTKATLTFQAACYLLRVTSQPATDQLMKIIKEEERSKVDKVSNQTAAVTRLRAGTIGRVHTTM